MRTGRPAAPRGFTYLGMLFFVAITAAALAALGQRWSVAVQREKERELEFRGREIAAAAAAYLKASERLGLGQQGPGAHPRSLDDLLLDARGPKPIHHLRRAYPDPFTGQPDWVLVSAPTDPNGFQALHSRSEQPLLRRLEPGSEEVSLASQRVFSIQEMLQPPAGAASAPAGASAPGAGASAP